MTNIVIRCKKCGEVIIQWKKGETEPSRLLKGANTALHMITCDKPLFDAIIDAEFSGKPIDPNMLDERKTK